MWIGGPPGGGKTTIAKRLARRYGLRWYNADAHTWEHRDRAVAAGVAAAIRWESLTPKERLVDASPEDMVAMTLHAERARMVVDDVRALPQSPMIVAEGSTVPASVVSAGVAAPSRSIWLLPTRELQLAQRGEQGGESNKDRAFVLLAEQIERNAVEHGVPILRVDGSRGVDEIYAVVEELFADALTAGPRAETPEERRALLRYANDAVVAQARGFLSRVGTPADLEVFTRVFVCECGNPRCEEDLEMPVAAFERAAAAGAVTAPRHR